MQGGREGKGSCGRARKSACRRGSAAGQGGAAAQGGAQVRCREVGVRGTAKGEGIENAVGSGVNAKDADESEDGETASCARLSRRLLARPPLSWLPRRQA